MLDADQMAHEIALAYAQSLFRGQIERSSSVPAIAAAMNKPFIDLYIEGTKAALANMDKIKAAYVEGRG